MGAALLLQSQECLWLIGSPVLERPAEMANSPIIYDLVANVTQESTAGTQRDKESTVWKVHLRAGHGEREQWLQMQDMIVEDIRKEMIFLGETVMQVRYSCLLSTGCDS